MVTSSQSPPPRPGALPIGRDTLPDRDEYIVHRAAGHWLGRLRDRVTALERQDRAMTAAEEAEWRSGLEYYRKALAGQTVDISEWPQ